ncbi:MAG: FISUMP domain-containing protein [Tamlana sp.]
MRKFYAILCLTIASLTQLHAQAPQGFNYQATVRNSSGDLILNTNVYFKFNVMQGSQTSLPVFTEIHYVPTDDLGQVNLVIGQGTATTGAFSSIDWSLGSYYLGIELDTGNGYVAMGTTQLLSVPYALYAENSGNAPPTTPNLETVLAENNSANNQQIKDLQDPTDAQDAVTFSVLLEKITELQNQLDYLGDLENWSDSDGDGFTELSGDCNDSDASINPGIYEVSDGIDNNCDGEIDEGYNGFDDVIDIDGNNYNFAIYGDQVWTVENAEMVTYRDGTPIPEVTDQTQWSNLTTGAWSYYNNDPTKPRFYNWYAVMGIHDTDPNTPNKEFAPDGWHVPTDAEWTTLENHLITNGYNYDDTTTENKIAKAMASTTGWNSSTTDGAPGNGQSLNNSSGFNGFPEGYRSSNGSFYNEGNGAFFWSSTENNTDSAWTRYLYYYDYSYLVRSTSGKRNGLSVRFVRD